MKGSKSSPSTRLLSTPINARIIRKIIQKQCIRPNHVFVNSSIDTLFAVKQAIQCRLTLATIYLEMTEIRFYLICLIH
jgi:hypothetical protein